LSQQESPKALPVLGLVCELLLLRSPLYDMQASHEHKSPFVGPMSPYLCGKSDRADTEPGHLLLRFQHLHKQVSNI